MKKLLVLCFFAGCCIAATAQSKKIKQVQNACEEFRAAMVDPTTEKLEALIDDSLTYGHSSGHIDHKTEFVQKLTSGKSDFLSIRISNQTIQVHGKTAFVRQELNAETNDNGKPGTVHLLLLLVWVKAHGGWKLAARQAVKPT